MQTLGDLKILVVEDLDSDFQFTNDCLTEIGLSCSRATTLLDAASKIGGEQWDVVLLDLCLPDSQGLDTVKAVHKLLDESKYESAPIVVLSGINDFAISKEALKLGAKDYLVKGEYGPHELTRAITFVTLTASCPRRTEKKAFGLF